MQIMTQMTMNKSDAETDYKEYIERLAKCNHITTEEAETHFIAKEVKKYYEDKYKGQS